MHRLLVLRGGALGDFIVTLPALAALRKRWPAARIELVGNVTAGKLALASGLLDAVHSQHEARWAALYSAAALPAEFSTWLASFDLVLNFWPDADGDLARRFPLRPEQRFLSAAAPPTIAPAAAHYCEPLRRLGILAESYFYQLPALNLILPRKPAAGGHFPEREQARGLRGGEKSLGKNSDRGPIAIHPGSGSLSKNWPIARWLELGAWLKDERHVDLIVITGDAESPETRAAFSGLGRTAHALPLEELAATLASCRFFLGHDSGVSHLAAACGVPSLLLFGPTDPAMWAPPAPQVQWLKKGEAVDAIPVADVRSRMEAVLQYFQKS